ncbi:hypothetical protein [Chryseobacterium sp.]|uniref:hypothetical protein n=1 Tax=Chryseobacterium sp. TaxID=1871047 RepID=UPI0011C9AF1D|nr:hypothetical protein [Chryseobacterium sp.]TXF77775.1 hypothetical protein FUA25_07585 [Chryseobacterium sp.]
MRTIILIVWFSVSLLSCNTQTSKDRKIKRTVTEFLNAVEKNDANKYKSLIYESDLYPGVISMEKKFFNKNYNKINSIVDLKKNIQVKDTIFNTVKRQYVQYRIKNSNPDYLHKPLIITFMFYEQVGYDKIYNPGVLKNFLEWE